MSIVAEERLERNFSYERMQGIFIPVMSVVLAIVIGAIFLALSGTNPVDAYQQLYLGAFGSLYNTSETFVTAIPLMLAGLAVAFAFRAGLFNIGAEGQIFMGAVFSAFVGYKLNLPAPILIPLALIAGAGGGALWAGIAGVLKAWRGAHEVITTMMLNYTAIFLTNYLLQPSPNGQPGPMEQTTRIGYPETAPMNAHLPVIIPNSLVVNNRLHAGLLVALGAGAIFWFILWRTSLGYKIRAVGLNPKAAAFAGIGVGWNIAIAMMIAGAFAGLGGMVSVYGLSPYSLTSSFSPGYGFDAIAVALLGKNNVIGVILAAILFGAFDHGGALMQSNVGASIHLVEILQGLIIFFIGADAIMRYLTRRGVVRFPLWQTREAAA